MRVEDLLSERPDPTHDGNDTRAAWTTVNAAEAMPGVGTPLGWTWFFEGGELGLRGAFADIGAIPTRDVRVFGDLDKRFIGMFYGHFAGNLDMMRYIGDQMPGSSGDAVEEQYFGESRKGIPSSRNPGRIPIVVGKLPVNAWRAKRRVQELRDEVDGWWRRAVTPGSTGDAEAARAVFRRALRYWQVICRAHTVVSMIGQGLFEQTRRVCVAAGKPGLELRVVSASSDVYEARMIADLWDVANGATSMERFLADHGFHGPAEGELSSKSWREDAAPLLPLLEVYRDRARPSDVSARGEGDRRAAEAELFGALGSRDRLRAKLVLRLARVFIPLREEGRSTFLKSYDVARCMARRIGEALVEQRVLEDVEDVFFLTVPELLGALPADPREEVAFRRSRRVRYTGVELPERWEGAPIPIEIAARDEDGSDRATRIDAIGVSPGRVEGRVRVVIDPADPGDIGDGEILVCKTTDPSWASLFFIVSACVIDVGGPMSHGAILARELGIPCVINTRDGTRTLRTGDIVRVDGDAGTVDVLEAMPS
ncbi:MAG: PEP-utilizing enzyme [Actinomycetota bacterium]